MYSGTFYAFKYVDRGTRPHHRLLNTRESVGLSMNLLQIQPSGPYRPQAPGAFLMCFSLASFAFLS